MNTSTMDTARELMDLKVGMTLDTSGELEGFEQETRRQTGMNQAAPYGDRTITAAMPETRRKAPGTPRPRAALDITAKVKYGRVELLNGGMALCQLATGSIEEKRATFEHIGSSTPITAEWDTTYWVWREVLVN